MNKKVIHYIPYTQRTFKSEIRPEDRTKRGSVPTHIYQHNQNSLPNHLAMRESFINKHKHKPSTILSKQSEFFSGKNESENGFKNSGIKKIQQQNKKLERMWLYLRDCNITGLGFNQEYYQKKKESIIGQPTPKVNFSTDVQNSFSSFHRVTIYFSSTARK